jgi:hypothetical protein
MDDKENAAPAASGAKLAPVSPMPTPRLDELIDHWHHESFHGTELGNHTGLWNLVVSAKEDLKKRLAKI